MVKRDRVNAVFVISVAAELAGMHPQTLRIYERKGLLEPFRTPGGTRRYSQEDIDRLFLIQELTEKGLNLEGVKQVLKLQGEIENLRESVENLQQQMDSMLSEQAEKLRAVHRSYRREIVLRPTRLPDVKR